MVKPHLAHFTICPTGPLFRHNEHSSFKGVAAPLVNYVFVVNTMVKQDYDDLTLTFFWGVPSRFAVNCEPLLRAAPDLVKGGSGVPNCWTRARYSFSLSVPLADLIAYFLHSMPQSSHMVFVERFRGAFHQLFDSLVRHTAHVYTRRSFFW